MRRRAGRAGLLGIAIATAMGCVELPRTASSAQEAALDASLSVVDAGARRPPTADGPAAPGACWQEPDSGGDGGGATGPSAGDGGRVGAGGATGGGSGSGGAQSSAPRTPRAVSEIVITELMSNPALVADGQGEWIELHNPRADTDLDLAGCALDDGGARKALAEALIVPAGGLVTLARSEALGFTPDHTLSFSLANEADVIALECDGVVIDRVAYGAGFPLAAGISMALDPAAFDATQNDDPAAWCLSPGTSYAEQGTPGEINAPCHADADAGR